MNQRKGTKKKRWLVVVNLVRQGMGMHKYLVICVFLKIRAVVKVNLYLSSVDIFIPPSNDHTYNPTEGCVALN